MWHWYLIGLLFIALVSFLRWWLPFTLSGDSVFTINRTPVYYAHVITDKFVEPMAHGADVLDEAQWTDFHTIAASDSHMGNGYTLGVVKAWVNMTMEQFNAESSPYIKYIDWDKLRSGLLEKIHDTEGIMRFSTSSFFNVTNLQRLAISIPTPHLVTPNISVHLMETSTFVIPDDNMLYVYMYEQRWGTWWKRLMHPKLSTDFFLWKKEWLRNQAGTSGISSVAKTYYSVTPFQLWDHYMKLALVPSTRNPSDTPENATNVQLRETFRKYVEKGDIEYDFVIQVSEHKLGDDSPTSTPMADLSKDWIAPWLKIGTVKIPRQEIDDSGLSHAVPINNSKVLFMNPCNDYHPPVEPVGKFRCALYPHYDRIRQSVILNRTTPQCPFATQDAKHRSSDMPHAHPHLRRQTPLKSIE